MAIFMGVVPGLFLKPMEPAVRKTIEHIRPQATAPINTELEKAKPAVSSSLRSH